MLKAGLIRQELMREYLEYLEYSARHLTEEVSYQGYLERALFHALGGLDDSQRDAVLDCMPIAEDGEKENRKGPFNPASWYA